MRLVDRRVCVRCCSSIRVGNGDPAESGEAVFLFPGSEPGQGPSIEQEGSTTYLKLVALGVSAEVVVIVQDQYSSAGGSSRAIEVRCRQSADSATHDDQVIHLVRIRARLWLATIAQGVCILERARMAASQAGQQRRVISRTVLGWHITFMSAP
jgi:hypothetical protein